MSGRMVSGSSVDVMPDAATRRISHVPLGATTDIRMSRLGAQAVAAYVLGAEAGAESRRGEPARRAVVDK
jgi:hypothetical protein